MRRLQLLLFGCLGLAVVDGTAAAELSTRQTIASQAVAKADDPSFEATATSPPTNKEKIVGTWLWLCTTPDNGRRDTDMTIVLEFTKDGKIKIAVTFTGMAKLSAERTYVVDGDKLYTPGRKAAKIKELTGARLVLEENGEVDEYNRKK